MAGKDNRVDLTTLLPEELAGLREQFETEVQNLYQSLQTMQNIATKYSHSANAINDLKQQEPGKSVLLPLTSSLYVSGELEDPSTVLIDVGTGYYVEKSCDEGKDFCSRKVDMLQKNIQNLLPQIRQKQELMNQVGRVYQMKMMQQQQQQQQAGDYLPPHYSSAIYPEEHDDLLGGLRHHHTSRPGLQSGGAMDALQSALRETGLRYDNPSAASTPSRGHSRPAYAPAERAPAEAPLWDAAYRASHRQPAARRQPGLDSLWQEPGGGDKGGGGGADGDDALEAAVVARLRKAEVLGQQMTLPEDIVQAGSGAAITALAAGGAKSLFGRRAHERIALPPSRPVSSRRRSAYGGKPGASPGPQLQRADSPGVPTPLDTPDMLEMRDGAEVLVVLDPSEPLTPEGEGEGGRPAPSPPPFPAGRQWRAGKGGDAPAAPRSRIDGKRHAPDARRSTGSLSNVLRLPQGAATVSDGGGALRPTPHPTGPAVRSLSLARRYVPGLPGGQPAVQTPLNNAHRRLGLVISGHAAAGLPHEGGLPAVRR